MRGVHWDNYDYTCRMNFLVMNFTTCICTVQLHIFFNQMKKAKGLRVLKQFFSRLFLLFIVLYDVCKNIFLDLFPKPDTVAHTSLSIINGISPKFRLHGILILPKCPFRIIMS